jgi:dynactin complex subunit
MVMAFKEAIDAHDVAAAELNALHQEIGAARRELDRLHAELKRVKSVVSNEQQARDCKPEGTLEGWLTNAKQIQKTEKSL